MQRVQHARGWSFLPKATFIITLGLITAATGFKASAVDVFTDPVGFITLTAEGTAGPGSSPANSFLGLGMTPILANRGAITAISGNDITVNSTLTAGQFAVGPNGPLFYIEFLTGANPGLTDDVVSNSATDVFTANNDSGAVAGATTYKIYPHWTLNSLFGSANQAGLDLSDQILVQNPISQSFATYFFAKGSKSLGTGWRQTGQGATDFGNQPLYGDQGLVFSRTIATNTAVMLVGAVKLANTLIPISPLNNFVANVYATSSMTLSSSALFTDGSQTDSLTTADFVLIHNDAAGSFNTYFFAKGSKSLGTGWRQSGQGATDQGQTSIPIGANVVIQLTGSESGFNWAAPAPY